MSKISAYWLIVIGIALIVGSGYWFWVDDIQPKLNKNSGPVIEDPEWMREQVAKRLEAETADWQTYRNEKYGFEVKYPGDWVIKKTIDNSAVYILIFGSPNFSYSSSTKLESVITQGREMGVRIFKYRSHKSPQELNDAIIHDGNLIGIKNTNFKIVGSDRMIYDFVYEETYGHSLHILADSIEIEIGILAGSSESASETRKIFDQILSTFKFSE